MSGELVPISYEREAWNDIHGKELTDPVGRLTPYQAERVNDYYDIELYFGTHGIAPTPTDPFVSPHSRPTQLEYDEAAKAVADLGPRDTLFIEGHGFDWQLPPREVPQVPGRQESFGEFPSGMSFGLELLTMSINRLWRSVAEVERKEYRISAWTYAAQIATSNSTRVMSADYDAFDMEKKEGLRAGTISNLLVSSDPEDRAFAERIQRQRERKALRILIDDALTGLPQTRGVSLRKHVSLHKAPITPKPKLRLLFGSGHKEEIEALCAEAGLKTATTVMASSTQSERLLEHYKPEPLLVMPLLLSILSAQLAIDLAKGTHELLTNDTLPEPDEDDTSQS